MKIGIEVCLKELNPQLLEETLRHIQILHTIHGGLGNRSPWSLGNWLKGAHETEEPRSPRSSPAPCPQHWAPTCFFLRAGGSQRFGLHRSTTASLSKDQVFPNSTSSCHLSPPIGKAVCQWTPIIYATSNQCSFPSCPPLSLIISRWFRLSRLPGRLFLWNA